MLQRTRKLLYGSGVPRNGVAFAMVEQHSHFLVTDAVEGDCPVNVGIFAPNNVAGWYVNDVVAFVGQYAFNAAVVSQSHGWPTREEYCVLQFVSVIIA